MYQPIPASDLQDVQQFPFRGGYGLLARLPYLPCVYEYWEGSPDAVSWMALNEAGLAMVKEHRLVGWLADLPALGPVPEELNEWILHDAQHRIVGAGVQRLANVLPEDFFAQLAVAAWGLAIRDGFLSLNTMRREDALAWLQRELGQSPRNFNLK